ncbi:terminase large subunit domain-containing protein [Ruegeria arenilitoris]|uniref:terminase large subunit domain-containing protein n=1 Tax=Ruegeria arenilitoris TaxID=1173585 RepID=UPI00147FB5C8|nr:terminase family protein [Ruegeria arenilitoris]
MPRRTKARSDLIEGLRRQTAIMRAIVHESAKLDPCQWAEKALGFPLVEFQRKVMLSKSDRLCVLAARQSGKSQISAALCANQASTRANYRINIIAPTFRQGLLLAEKIEHCFQSHDVGYKRIREQMTLENGSRINIYPGDRPESVRGGTCDLLCVDEAGFIKDSLVAAVVPQIAATRGRMVLISTPNGPRGFLFDSYNAPEFETMKVSAYDIEHFDQDLIAELKARLGPALSRQEIESDFVASGASVFDSSVLDNLFSPSDAVDVFDSDETPIRDSSLMERFKTDARSPLQEIIQK